MFCEVPLVLVLALAFKGINTVEMWNYDYLAFYF